MPVKKSTRLYYLTRDGKRVVSKHPTDRVKASTRATSATEAWGIFRSRFIQNPDGSLGKRLPGGQGDTRRVTIREAGQAAPIDTALQTSMGGVNIPMRFKKAAVADAKLEPEGELLSEVTDAVDQMAQTATPQNRYTEFEIRGVGFRVVEGTKVTITDSKVFLLPPPPPAAVATVGLNLTDVLLAGPAE